MFLGKRDKTGSMNRCFFPNFWRSPVFLKSWKNFLSLFTVVTKMEENITFKIFGFELWILCKKELNLPKPYLVCIAKRPVQKEEETKR